MSNLNTTRKNWMPPVAKSSIMSATGYLKRGDVWAKIGLCLLLSVILWACMTAWSPAFHYRMRHTPLRNLHARVEFEYDDYKLTEDAREQTKRKFLCLYANDTQALSLIRQTLMRDLFEIHAKPYEGIAESGLWTKFYSEPKAEEGLEPPPSPATAEDYQRFREAIKNDEKLESLEAAIREVFRVASEKGLLENVEHEGGPGSLSEIEVYPKGADIVDRERVAISEVRLPEFLSTLQAKLLAQLKKLPEEKISSPEFVAERIYHRLRPAVPATLTYDAVNSSRELAKVLDAVGVKKRLYKPGESLERYRRDLSLRGILGKEPLAHDDLDLLRAEHNALVASEGTTPKVVRSFIFIGLCMVLFWFVAQFLYFRHPQLLDDFRQFLILVTLMAAALIVATLLTLIPAWRAEIIIVMLFAMGIAIAYNSELSMFLSSLVAMTYSISHGFGLPEFAILVVASTASAFMCKQIRSRTKLVNTSMIVAIMILPVVLGIHYLFGQPFSTALVTEGLWFAAGAGIAGLTMTALLPFLEGWFDVQTDINLLELGDPNNVLLRELVQRAPGTYNHSINVASISEAAAEAIGANGLLCRVGSYFHDIGKIRKPEYFIENQSGINKHDDLNPTMSTLVIVAHVKDGAELARTHGLPRRIVDLIEQHHGTTLVEYFFKRAEKQQAEKEESLQEEVDEADYRYPGPKPQTLEAAVLMLADSVESASRTLREPAPSRIENLVFDISRKKLEDGQFDECPITLQQLHRVQNSLIKSLNAMHHVRVQYPEKQQSA